MEIYITKKLERLDNFVPVNKNMPYMHFITGGNVEISLDLSTRCFYISKSDNDNFFGTVIKLKKLICKNITRDKHKDTLLTDDIIWVKSSPIMYYMNKNGDIKVPCNKVPLDMPVNLQLSCNAENLHYYEKPYNSCNICFQIDYVIMPDDFDWSIFNN